MAFSGFVARGSFVLGSLALTHGLGPQGYLPSSSTGKSSESMQERLKAADVEFTLKTLDARPQLVSASSTVGTLRDTSDVVRPSSVSMLAPKPKSGA